MAQEISLKLVGKNRKLTGYGTLWFSEEERTLNVLFIKVTFEWVSKNRIDVTRHQDVHFLNMLIMNYLTSIREYFLEKFGSTPELLPNELEKDEQFGGFKNKKAHPDESG